MKTDTGSHSTHECDTDEVRNRLAVLEQHGALEPTARLEWCDGSRVAGQAQYCDGSENLGGEEDD